MRRLIWCSAILSTVMLIGPGCAAPSGVGEEAAAEEGGTATQPAQEKGGQEEFGHYEPVADWPRPLPDEDDGVTHEGWTWGSQAAIYAETPDRIWVAQRGEREVPPEWEGEPWTPGGLIEPPLTATSGIQRFHHVIFVLDGDGNMIESWLQHDDLFDQDVPLGARGPHRIKMNPYDPEKHVWVIADNIHQIFKFTYDGELVMTLGQTGVEGRGPNTFARPTDIAWLPDGTFFITDGYHGTRVAKFDPEGNFLMDWGQEMEDPENPGPNEFNTVHSIAISEDRRLFVVDRNNHRMQVFDEDGNFLEMWPTGVHSLVYGHVIARDRASDEQYIWAVDGGLNRVVKWDLDGNFQYAWGIGGTEVGQFDGPHSISIDQEGNLYTAEVFNGRIQKFVPKEDGDPTKIARMPARPAH